MELFRGKKKFYHIYFEEKSYCHEGKHGK